VRDQFGDALPRPRDFLRLNSNIRGFPADAARLVNQESGIRQAEVHVNGRAIALVPDAVVRCLVPVGTHTTLLGASGGLSPSAALFVSLTFRFPASLPCALRTPRTNDDESEAQFPTHAAGYLVRRFKRRTDVGARLRLVALLSGFHDST
jgi:hypothetical protein